MTPATVGASVDEVIDTLVAVSATVGMARVVAATPGMANALGIDIDAALEQIMIDTPVPRPRVVTDTRNPRRAMLFTHRRKAAASRR